MSSTLSHPLDHPETAFTPQITADVPPQTGDGRLGLMLLVLFAFVTSFAGLGSGPPLGDHECINAQAARQVLQSGEWLIPKLGEIPRVRKTPLGIWSIALASRIVDAPDSPRPVSDFAALLPSAIAAFLTTLVIYWLGRMMYGQVGGLIAGFIWAGSTGMLLFSHNAQVDMLLTLFTAASFACFWRGAVHAPRSRLAMIGFYVAFALAMMSKAPLPLATVGMALAIYWLLAMPVLIATDNSTDTRTLFSQMPAAMWAQFKRIPQLWIFLGVPLWLILVCAWPLYVLMHVDNAATLWKFEYVDMLTGDATDKRQPFLYYIPVILGLAAPYFLSLPEAIAAPFLSKYRDRRYALAFAFVWGIWGVLFLSTSSIKRYHYPLSVMPAFCLMLAPVIEQLFFKAQAALTNRARWACLALPIVIAVGLAAFGLIVHAKSPSLLRSYLFVGVLLLATWSVAAWSYARGEKLMSFAQLNLGILILICLGWPIAGQHIAMNATADALVVGFRDNGVKPSDEIYLVDTRPDSSIEFYSQYRIRRLINELEMASLRPNRREVPMALYSRMAQAITEKLSQPHPVYLILGSANYELLKRNVKVPTKILFRVNASGKRAGTEPVVLTNQVYPPGGAAIRPN